MKSLEIHKAVELIKIAGDVISYSTSQEDCIREDKFSLSSLVKRTENVKDELVTVTVGRFEGSAILKKTETLSVDKSKPQLLIELTVLEIFEFFQKDMNKSLSTQTAKKIYEDYYWLKLSELKLFAERMKGGYWAQMHNLSPAVLMERLADFADESLAIREQLSGMEVEKDKEVEIALTDKQKEDFGQFVKEMVTKVYDSEKDEREEKERRRIKTKVYHDENRLCFNWLENSNAKCVINATQKERELWYNLFQIRKQ